MLGLVGMLLMLAASRARFKQVAAPLFILLM
jgi:hypothetical protein